MSVRTEPRQVPGRMPLVEITVGYELDSQTVPRLRTLVEEALTLRPRHLVLNLEHCAFLDASAIALLLETHRKIWLDDGLLTLRGPSLRVQHTLELAGLTGVFHLTTSDAIDTPESTT